MTSDINININSILGSIAIMSLVILFIGIGYKHYYPNSEIPDNVFIGAAIILGFIISVEIYANTDLGLLLSFTTGYIPAFIMLGFIISLGWILFLLDILALLLICYFGGVLR